MDGIIIKLIETLGIPGFFIALIYFLWNQKIISTIRSSETERLFFSHEKKFLYNSYNKIVFYLIIVLIMSIISFNYLKYADSVKFLNSAILEVFLYCVLGVLCLSSFVLYLLKNNKVIEKILNKINESEFLSNIIMIAYFTLIICSFSIICAKQVSSNFVNNRDEMMLFSIVINSLFLPSFWVYLIKQWLRGKRICFSFKEDTDVWYLIKPLNDSDFIIGDNFTEEDCKKLKLSSLSELKNKELSVTKEHYGK